MVSPHFAFFNFPVGPLFFTLGAAQVAGVDVVDLEGQNLIFHQGNQW